MSFDLERGAHRVLRALSTLIKSGNGPDHRGRLPLCVLCHGSGRCAVDSLRPRSVAYGTEGLGPRVVIATITLPRETFCAFTHLVIVQMDFPVTIDPQSVRVRHELQRCVMHRSEDCDREIAVDERQRSIDVDGVGRNKICGCGVHDVEKPLECGASLLLQQLNRRRDYWIVRVVVTDLGPLPAAKGLPAISDNAPVPTSML